MEQPTEAELITFVDSNANKYLKEWQSVLANNPAHRQFNLAGMGFNWAAFFLSGFWLPYRKMYVGSVIFFSIIFVESVLEELFFVGILGQQNPPAILSHLIFLPISLIFGLFGNSWYLSHTLKAVSSIKSKKLPEDKHLMALKKNGGTNLLAAFGMPLAFIILTGGTFWLLYSFGFGDPHYKGAKYLEKGDYQNAIIEFEHVLAKNPQNWATYGYLGDTYRRLGENDKAIDNYKKSLSYNPEAIESYEGLALSYADKGIKFNEAIALIEKTKEIMKDDISTWNKIKGFYLESLSWGYFRKGDKTKAIKYFDEAYPIWQKDFKSDVDEFDPYFSEIHYRFGVLLIHKGDKKKAYEEFEKAIRCDKSSIFAKKAQKEIDKLKRSKNLTSGY